MSAFLSMSVIWFAVFLGMCLVDRGAAYMRRRALRTRLYNACNYRR